MNPIGFYQTETEASAPYQVPRQPDDSERLGCIELLPHQQFEQALKDLEGFERIWVIYQFHLNSHWHPQVLPPRGSLTKRGLFATRSPYRPNSIGLSCVKLQKIQKLKLWILGADLLNETPILDLKPYIPSSDSFPDSRIGWLEGVNDQKYKVLFSDGSALSLKLAWIQKHGLSDLVDFAIRQLEYEPFDHRRKRVTELRPNLWQLAYKTWRIQFQTTSELNTLQVIDLTSGYHETELGTVEDPHQDKALHRAFCQQFAMI
jgi:tRNA-Thr(GGU) m(6)t(6)A37 methyltransferase TsaA